MKPNVLLSRRLLVFMVRKPISSSKAPRGRRCLAPRAAPEITIEAVASLESRAPPLSDAGHVEAELCDVFRENANPTCPFSHRKNLPACLTRNFLAGRPRRCRDGVPWPLPVSSRLCTHLPPEDVREKCADVRSVWCPMRTPSLYEVRGSKHHGTGCRV